MTTKLEKTTTTTVVASNSKSEKKADIVASLGELKGNGHETEVFQVLALGNLY